MADKNVTRASPSFANDAKTVYDVPTDRGEHVRLQSGRGDALAGRPHRHQPAGRYPAGLADLEKAPDTVPRPTAIWCSSPTAAASGGWTTPEPGQ